MSASSLEIYGNRFPRIAITNNFFCWLWRLNIQWRIAILSKKDLPSVSISILQGWWKEQVIMADIVSYQIVLISWLTFRGICVNLSEFLVICIYVHISSLCKDINIKSRHLYSLLVFHRIQIVSDALFQTLSSEGFGKEKETYVKWWSKGLGLQRKVCNLWHFYQNLFRVRV